MAHHLGADTRFMVDDLIRAGAVSRLPVKRAVAICGQHRQVVVRHQPRQIGVTAGQLDRNRVLVVLDDFDDVGKQCLGGRGRLFAAMMV